MQKLYCYVDETGQDTKGRFFLVSLLVASKDSLTEFRNKILKVEEGAKGKSKWTKTNNKNKSIFIKQIKDLKILNGCIFYCVYNDTTAYTPLVAMSVGKAVINKTSKQQDNYRVNIIIDGLRKSDREIIRMELKNLGIKYNKIKINLKDEQEVLLRLTDALAGFVRDYSENKKYAVESMNKAEFKRLFKKI